MNSRKAEILHTLKLQKTGKTANEMAEILGINRANVSRYLNELVKAGEVSKGSGRPVIYEVMSDQVHVDSSTGVTFKNLVGESGSLEMTIQQAKAAILYPPRGLHTIIFGDTGTGKSLFAECMHHFALEARVLAPDAPFVAFNCADYAQNPQLLSGHIFGIKKGAYTGASEDSVGLLAKADGGILFLDEIHRLPPEGQEMLFTFIDKGVYRPLGESAKVHEASVQIIGATTEPQGTFLTTFNRRIPMSLTLPNLASRSLDERYEIITLFIKQEANRLNQRIAVEKDAIVAFMLYDAEGNIGQVKRDLKLVCAKSFLHYRTHDEQSLLIRKQDCSLQVQKGLLKTKECADDLNPFLEGKGEYLSFDPGEAEVVWSQDPQRNMQVYNDIEEKVASLSSNGLKNVDLEKLISHDVDIYFETYVEKLTEGSPHKELLSPGIWELTNELYDLAQEQLKRSYNEKARFAFALHLQSTIERVKEGHRIVHPDLNTVRKNLKSEFQVALDLSSIIEDKWNIEIPFDEIGFISMFLSIQVGDSKKNVENMVEVILMMHGKKTATSMLETAQELLGSSHGKAMNMALDTPVQKMYDELLAYINENKARLSAGVLLLTDMGSLNTFAHLIKEETGVRTKAISMTSTMVVLEALRMAGNQRSLEDIHQNIQMAFEVIFKNQFKTKAKPREMKKAIVVTCFTGEGVAAKLYQRIVQVVDQSQVEIIQMQFIERAAFIRQIDSLLETYEIKAIAGSVEIQYQNIPFFSAYEIFEDQPLQVLKRIVLDEVPIEKMIHSLEGIFTEVKSVESLVILLQKIILQIQGQMQVVIEPSVDAGVIMHLAFLIEGILHGDLTREFPDLVNFLKKHRLENDLVRTNLMVLEREYQIKIPEDEVAFVTQMFLENKLTSNHKVTHKSSV
ncbi:MAG: sigma 54-interacting transcriptional regulator [Enterococcus sp.]